MEGTMTDDQMIYSAKLDLLFLAYANSLGLTDVNGRALTLDAAGN